MKHTPGPWTVKEYGKESSFYIYAEAFIYRDAIAQVHDRTTAEGKANAQLIAAAPMLAEALLEWVNDSVTCPSTQNPAPYPDCDCWVCTRTRTARAALAAAGVLS